MGGPWWRVASPEDILFILTPEISEIGVLEKVRGVAPGEREENVVDERDWSRRAFNVQQYALWRHDTNDRPRQTGSKRASTPLSVYTGVQPAGS